MFEVLQLQKLSDIYREVSAGLRALRALRAAVLGAAREFRDRRVAGSRGRKRAVAGAYARY